jgi:hypothetical protein
VACCKRGDQVALVGKECIGTDEQRANPLLRGHRECRFDFAFSACVEDSDFLPEPGRRGLD